MSKIGPIIIGKLNVTGIANLREIVNDINQSIDQVQNAGNEQIAEILREISQAVITDPRFEKQPPQATIETLRTLAREASLAPEKRHLGTVKFGVAYLSLMLNTSLNVLDYLQVHMADLRKFFGIPA
jgi:hypothetical protein